jgi:hypothetical protein
MFRSKADICFLLQSQEAWRACLFWPEFLHQLPDRSRVVNDRRSAIHKPHSSTTASTTYTTSQLVLAVYLHYVRVFLPAILDHGMAHNNMMFLLLLGVQLHA